MKLRILWVAGLIATAISGSLSATVAELYFSSDRDGQARVTLVQEGAEVWIAVFDPDENIDCDVRDKIWTDVKIMDPKTGAYMVWKSYVDPTGSPAGKLYDDDGYVPYKGHWPEVGGWLGADYFEETGADTGLFVSSRAFRIGTRESYAADEPWKATHVVDLPASPPRNFIWGNYLYADIKEEGTKLGGPAGGDVQRWVGADDSSPIRYGTGIIPLASTAYVLPSDLDSGTRMDSSPSRWLIGRFENMDTLIGLYQDPNDGGDVALSMMKIIDTEATISWDREVYKDADAAATITVVDPDENLDCSRVDVVPVFILVNPGSWNPANSADDEAAQTGDSPNNFCMLKRTGGIKGDDQTTLIGFGSVVIRPIRWSNIYNSDKNDHGVSGAMDGRYYVQYPKRGVFPERLHKTLFDTASANGVTAVSFYASETAVNSGIFQLNLNSILVDLGFDSLQVRDVLVAYYLDPNDEDDFKLATAYIEERQHSIASYTNSARQDQGIYWLGRDSVYVQVIDANANVDSCCPEQVLVHICDPHDEDDGEFWILDETGSNSPVFFSGAGMELGPVWDALGVGLADTVGGYQLILDNWKLEAFNEDDVYVRYNDVYYVNNDQGMLGVGDSNTYTAYSGPRIDRVRVGNDVSFDVMSIADTQVYDGQATKMYFLDRQGNRVSGYANSDCVFIEVIDPDQDEDQHRRERIAGFWDGGQNLPFGPAALNEWKCPKPDTTGVHPVNDLLGDTNIFDPTAATDDNGYAKIYVLNPRSGHWTALDLLETGVATGDFVSVICVDLTAVYGCVPTLGVLPGDTILAAYMDPSNHSDSAWISIKVGIGGGGTPPSQASTTMFVDADGNEVASYAQGEAIYVKVTDLSHTQDVSLTDAVTVEGITYDLTTYGSQSHMFITEPICLEAEPGEAITATYVDPTDATDSSSDTITIIASVLVVESFYAGPNPFDGEVSFGYQGSGIASAMSVEVRDLVGHVVWADEQSNVSKVVWNGTNESGVQLANGGYIYLVTATDGTNTFHGKGVVFIHR